jgi:hypothetical protein
MLQVNKDNSKAIPESSSIKLTRVDGFIISSLNFKHIVMVDYNALKSNQWFLNWFRTQAITTGHKESTIILEMCQVRKGGTLPYFDSILPIITKNNNILELQGFLKHNDFAGKSINKFKIPMSENLIKTNQYKTKKTIILEKNYNRLNDHLVFIGIFNFLGGKLESKQALFHSCLHFPNVLGQVIHFCKSN